MGEKSKHKKSTDDFEIGELSIDGLYLLHFYQCKPVGGLSGVFYVFTSAACRGFP